ncbi:MAG: 2-oxoacid:acceptor oxidoreductase family protein [Thermodesulfovibrionales bacterium]|nr:2-oxoacid:acceptor oxidoreductase family protein [Thermodesulfovibrionales bacterium]
MEKGIIIAGFGGQGILFLGRILAYAGMLENREVTWFPSYGGEMRGGTANCTVIISDELIASPIVRNPDILIVMNDESLRKFLPRLRQKGVLILDSSLVKNPALRTDIEVVRVPATEISNTIGNTKSANMVLLGAFIAKTNLLKKESTFEALENSMGQRKKGIEINKKAIMEGIRFFEIQISKSKCQNI